MRLDLGSLFSGIIGSSEENVRRAIRIAESVAPCILWLDEIEKGFSGIASSDISDAGTTAREITDVDFFEMLPGEHMG